MCNLLPVPLAARRRRFYTLEEPGPSNNQEVSIGGKMERDPRSFGVIIRQPSAFLPVVMSIAALAIVLVHIGIFGAAREADEGITAHLWQILMAGQMPVLAFFALKWLPRAPRQTLYVLALQAGAMLASIAPVFLLKL